MRHHIHRALLAGMLVHAACGANPLFPAPDTPAYAVVDRIGVVLPTSELVEGQTAQATAGLLDATGKSITGRTITWSTSDPAIATVDAEGLVAAISAGMATVTAACDGRAGP
jgi:hypothetical protein